MRTIKDKSADVKTGIRLSFLKAVSVSAKNRMLAGGPPRGFHGLPAEYLWSENDRFSLRVIAALSDCLAFPYVGIAVIIPPW